MLKMHICSNRRLRYHVIHQHSVTYQSCEKNVNFHFNLLHLKMRKKWPKHFVYLKRKRNDEWNAHYRHTCLMNKRSKIFTSSITIISINGIYFHLWQTHIETRTHNHFLSGKGKLFNFKELFHDKNRRACSWVGFSVGNAIRCRFDFVFSICHVIRLLQNVHISIQKIICNSESNDLLFKSVTFYTNHCWKVRVE